MELAISEILKITEGKILNPECKNSILNSNISGVSTDSRTIRKGELFIALKGEKFDGNNFAACALKKGAVGIVVSQRIYNLPTSSSQFAVQVPDTLKVLGDIAQAYRKKFKIPVIAIAGSSGKTTTKEIVSSLLSSQLKVLKSPHSYNNLIGLPLSILSLTSRSEVAVVEMEVLEKGKMKRLAEIAQPTIVIITNVGKAHTEFFGSLKENARSKGEILERCNENSISVLNQDDHFFHYFLLRAKKGKTLTFGIDKKSNFQAMKLTFDSFGRPTFFLNGEKKITLPFLGRANVYNVLASLACTSAIGMKLEDAIFHLSFAEPPSGRLNLKKINGYYLLDDTYNANPASFLNLIEVIEKIKARGKKILVLGDMLELGDSSKDEHRKIGELVSNSSIDIIFAVGEKTKFTIEAISKKKTAWHFKDYLDAKEKIKEILVKGDLLAFKGSRMMRMERLFP